MVRSSSSSTSDDDQRSAERSAGCKTFSDSDFQSAPILKNVKSPKEISTAKASKQQTSANMNVMTVLANIAKGTSKDFMSKMNAAMITNLPPKSPVAVKKLNKIGLDNDECSSSDNNKNLTKNTTHSASRKSTSSEESKSDIDETNIMKASPIKSILSTESKNELSSTDSEIEINIKKKALLLQNRQESTPKSSSEGSNSDSSNFERSGNRKVVKQVSFSKSSAVFAGDQNSQIRTSQKSSNLSSDTDSDSDDNDKIKRIEEIKQELKKLQTSGMRRKSICEDNNSKLTDHKSKGPKSSTPTNTLKTTKNYTHSTDSSNDEHMKSMLTQRDTPTRNASASSTSASDSELSCNTDTLKNEAKSSAFSSNKVKSVKDSEPDESSALKRDKLFSEFLNEHTDYREIKIKSNFDTTILSKLDEIYICTVPKYIPSDLLRNKEFNLNEVTTLNFGPDKYNIKCEQYESKKQSLLLINKNNNTSFASLDVVGQIKLLKSFDNIKMNKEIDLKGLTCDKKVTVPELKQRHPIFGSDLSKIILNKSVQDRLDSMIEDLNKKMNKSQKKKSNLDNERNRDDVQIIKEDIYKMLNFLQESSAANNENDKNILKKKKKSKRKSENENEEILFSKDVQEEGISHTIFAEPPTKKSRISEQDSSTPKKRKKSKLKLNLQHDLAIKDENFELGLGMQKPEKATKKIKKRHDIMANSTFASPLLNANLFESNESVIAEESAGKQSHAKKYIEKLVKIKVEENNSIATNSCEMNGSKSEPADSSISLKHLEKVIKNVAKAKYSDQYVESSIEDKLHASKNDDDFLVIKKKKKKKKDKSKENLMM